MQWKSVCVVVAYVCVPLGIIAPFYKFRFYHNLKELCVICNLAGSLK